ncbi:hypothetical protein ACFLUV_01355 [Elusimicrobiota bacterium]
MKRKILSIMIGIVILCFSFMGMVQFHKAINGAVSLLKTGTLYPSVSILEVNNFIKDISNTESTKTGSNTQEKKQDKKPMNLLFFIMSTVLISNEKLLLMLAIALIAVICKEIKKSWKQEVGDKAPPGLKYYIWWSLRFLNPLQKCVRILARKYDSNPVSFYGGRRIVRHKKPALCLS